MLHWDETNFLVDLSGHYATCQALTMPAGVVHVDRRTPKRETIVGIVDYIDGRGTDIREVNEYIQTVLKKWSASRLYNQQIIGAKRFGCSVRPACSSRAVVACLFSPGGKGSDELPSTQLVPTEAPGPDIPDRLEGQQKALAFTQEQYSEAESIMGRKWDRSHYLENLSGYETDCSMIESSDWPFTSMKQASKMIGVRIIGQYGHTKNLGSTPDALKVILSKFKPVSNVEDIGCSIIPHCILPSDRSMHVVVACLYEERG